MNQTELIQGIQSLRQKRNAIILAHNYQRGEIQDLADMVGDSLELSRRAAQTDAEVIVFCGVHFMAETAALLCPGKKVLIPDPQAGCAMAAMLTVRQLRRLKAEHAGAVVVCYVNSTAAVKADSDVCCTSANAVKVVASISEDRDVIFVPDRCLGDYVQRQLGRDLILWEGYCPTHHRIVLDDILKLKEEHPQAVAAVHPECTRDVLDAADFVGSTSGILKFCHDSSAGEFIIGTEMGMIHRLKKESPDRQFYQVGRFSDCPDMKLVTPEKVLWSLENLEFEVTVAPDVADAARRSVQRMVDVS